jgi:hypothetical protein
MKSWFFALAIMGMVGPAWADTSCRLGIAPYDMTVGDRLYSNPSVPKGHSCDSVAVANPCKAGVLAKSALYAGCMALEGFTGLNLNGSPEQLQPWMLQNTGAEWVRAFVNVVAAQSDVASGKRATGLDLPDWQTFRDLGASGAAKTILSLKFDFESTGQHPPLPRSVEEQALFDFLDRQILDPLAASTSIIVSGNEPFVNTLEEDWRPVDAYDGIPLVVFYQRVTAHVNDYLVQKGLRAKTRLFVGSFTRLYTDAMQRRPAVKQLFAFAESAPFVDGVDLHAHVDTVSQIDDAVAYAQSRTAKPLIVTEYTYIHAQKAALAAAQPIGAGFAQQWKVAPDTTELDFLRCNIFHRGPTCKTLPTVPRAEWDGFLTSRPWFVDHFLLKADHIFDSHGVLGVTFGLMQGKPSPDSLQSGALPWYLGYLYSPVSLGTDANGHPLPNYQYLDDFRHLTGQSN